MAGIGLGAACGLGLLGIAAALTPRPGDGPGNQAFASADWLGLLPEGEAKRRFILDCTGCHQFDERMARVNGRPRSKAEWVEAVSRMLGFAGATTGFPVIANDRDAVATAAWLEASLAREPTPRPPSGFDIVTGQVTEYDTPVAEDLPHDVAVDAAGRVIITGMFSHRVFVLDPASGSFETVAIPIPNANPRAVEIDSAGNWWAVLGQPMQVARYRPQSREWTSFPVGFYPHSLALGRPREVWVNGHFTRNPELRTRPWSGCPAGRSHTRSGSARMAECGVPS